MAELAIYGGLNEIGGNQIFVYGSSPKGILLDFGTRFEQENRFFEMPWVVPFSMPDLETIEAIPAVPGLYRNDPRASDVSAVLVSHAHADHFGYVPLLSAETQVFCGADTKNLIDIRYETYNAGWLTEWDHLAWNTFRTGDNVALEESGVGVRPIHVDHSVPASYAFVLEVDGKTVAYTGDLRRHGTRSDLTEDFLTTLRETHVDLLVTEGTRVGPAGSDPDEDFLRQMESYLRAKWGAGSPQGRRIECATESEVQVALTREFGRDSLFLIEVSPLDIDRLRSVWFACQSSGRRLVLTTRQAYMCREAGTRTKIADVPGPRDSALYLLNGK